MKTLYIYLLISKDNNIYVTKKEIVRETLFTVKTKGSNYRKKDLNRLVVIDKEDGKDYQYVTTEEVADPWQLFSSVKTSV